MVAKMDINSFSGSHRFLSNFWPSFVVLDEDTYPTVEHAYQAAKTEDKITRTYIRLATTPGYAKKLGRALILRPNWEEFKIPIMTDLVTQKFYKEPLRSLLIQTSPGSLVEGNTWGDTFWGVCRGKGSNHLGLILMKIRDELSQKEESKWI